MLRRIHQFVYRTVYRKEMIFVLGLKVILLMALWKLFFSHPTDKQLTQPQLAKHYLQETQQKNPA